MNKIQERIRDIYLAKVVGENEEFSSFIGFCKLWEWAKYQEWWNKKILFHYLKDNDGNFVNAVYRLLKSRCLMSGHIRDNKHMEGQGK